jgi:microcystin-dependent protein
MSNDLNLNSIIYQSALRSKPIRENFTDIQNNFNLLRAEVYASIASTASEVVSARGGFSALIDNINVRSIYGYGVNTGGVITQSGTPNNTVLFSAGNGICPDGSGVSWLGGTSATIGVVTKPRYGVAVINNDSSFAIEWGATATSPSVPLTSSSQLPLASIYQNTTSPVIITDSLINNNVLKKRPTENSSPAGSVVMYAGGSAPVGWLICDGSIISRSLYYDLFIAIGTSFGVGDGSTTFQIPDMRGASPAGVGTSTGYIQNETITLGQKIDDTMQGHKHTVPYSNSVIGAAGIYLLGTQTNAGTQTISSPITDGTSGTPRTGNITKGKSIGLNFIIKY